MKNLVVNFESTLLNKNINHYKCFEIVVCPIQLHAYKSGSSARHDLIIYFCMKNYL